VGVEVAGAAAIAAIAAAGLATRRRAKAPATAEQPAPPVAPQPAPVRVRTGETHIVRPSSSSVEGLEIRYAENSLVRTARVGAMNSEHKELLLVMDETQWNSLPTAQKQEVLAAARSTWAEKMCSSGPDIAYVVVKTDRGEIVGRAGPRSVTVL
jgi:hypothetical protein